MVGGHERANANTRDSHGKISHYMSANWASSCFRSKPTNKPKQFTIQNQPQISKPWAAQM